MQKSEYYKKKSDFYGAIAVFLLVVLLLLIWKSSQNDLTYGNEKSNYEAQLNQIAKELMAIEDERDSSLVLVKKLEDEKYNIQVAAKKEKEALLNAAWRIKKEYAGKTYGGVIEQPDTSLLCFGEAGVDSLNSVAIDFKACKDERVKSDSIISGLKVVISKDSLMYALCQESGAIKDSALVDVKKQLDKAKKETKFQKGAANFFKGLSGSFGIVLLIITLF